MLLRSPSPALLLRGQPAFFGRPWLAMHRIPDAAAGIRIFFQTIYLDHGGEFSEVCQTENYRKLPMSRWDQNFTKKNKNHTYTFNFF